MKLTNAPALINQAIKAMSATSSAVPAASALNRAVSPPAISPNEAPINNEIADVTAAGLVCNAISSSRKDRVVSVRSQ